MKYYASYHNSIIAVPVGDVKIYNEYDGEYTTNSKRKEEDEQVKFRLIVYSKEIVRRKKKKVVYFARATNLNLKKEQVLKLYNKVRTPIETSYRNIKAFLPFTSSTKYIFRTLIFTLAILMYSLYTILKKQVNLRTLKKIIIKILENMTTKEIYPNKIMKTLTNTIDLFLRG
ncbi:hypothetical protein YN1HA_19850 [Sulfurisphaera ohwakuensis]